MLHHVSRHSHCPTLERACAMHHAGLCVARWSEVGVRGSDSNGQTGLTCRKGRKCHSATKCIQTEWDPKRIHPIPHEGLRGGFSKLGEESCLKKCYAQTYGQWCAQSSCEEEIQSRWGGCGIAEEGSIEEMCLHRVSSICYPVHPCSSLGKPFN